MIKCFYCGKFISYDDIDKNTNTERIYDSTGAVEDIIYHKDCDNLTIVK